MSREYPGNRSADARDAGCRRDRTSRRHRLQRPGNILSRPAGKGVGVRPSDNNGYDETRERSGSPKSGETKEKQKQLYRQSHRSRKWRCRCLSVARPDCGNGRLNEKESASIILHFPLHQKGGGASPSPKHGSMDPSRSLSTPASTYSGAGSADADGRRTAPQHRHGRQRCASAG